jgi:tocopherol O-methyltransferase
MTATAEQIRAHYDTMALIYRTFWGDHIHHGLFSQGDEAPGEAQVKMIGYCHGLVAQGGIGSMLDVGCGHGGTLIHLATLHSGLKGLGLTLSGAQAEIAQENARLAGVKQRVDFLVQDAETFAYPQEAFDVVWNMESSEHFADKPRYFHRAAAALRPGGRLLVAAWTGSMASPQVRDVARDFLCPSLQTPAEYRAQMEAAGLRLVTEHDLTAGVVRTWELCRQRARLAAPLAPLLPRMVGEFVRAIDVILGAYRSGELTYTVLAAEKPLPHEAS